MNDTHLMKLFLDMPDRYRAVMLTENQRRTVEMVREWDFPTMSARELSELKYISVQSASQQLATLCRRGYLKREERTDPTGGILYRYKVAI